MAVRLTYTSGAIDGEIDAAFVDHLQSARDREVEVLGHVIAGEAVNAGEVFDRVDPANTSRLASRAHAADAAVVERAVAAARDARVAWRRTPFDERATKILAVAEAIQQRHIEIAAIVSLETGKTRVESIVEVQEAIDLIGTYASHLQANQGYVAPLASYTDNETNTEHLVPYGTFGVICPFNFPFALTVGMSVAALLAGNSVVVKPSEDTPWTGQLFAEVTEVAQLPAGVFNLIQGGPETGRLLVESAVDGIAFTGSAEVGREIVRKLQSGRYGRPALTEMGGKNPAIVTAKADVAKAAQGVARAAFGLSGQKCSACSRALVFPEVYDEFVASLVEFTQELKIGDPVEDDSYMGPVVNERSVKRFETAAAAAREDGRVLAGGSRPDLPGYYVEPTVVDGLPRGHRLERNELFLPFVAVTRVADLDDALAEANAIDYGLTAGIFSEDDEEVAEFLDRIEAGVVYVNRGAGATTGAWPGTQSFCGWKASGTTGKGGLAAYYLPQFMREQSRTIVR